ncbi:MAG: SagB/ThcOx family dehydrogenase [Acidobacteria bacterium]|nr:SagB/ThcOx family dehydrogenase [Acidobacteriota bacterium]
MAVVLSVLLGCLTPTGKGGQVASRETRVNSTSQIALPEPARTGRMSLEEALARRRCVREFSSTPLTEQEVSQLLWAAQGITHPEGLRTAPSAGALYPLELYVATAGGFYHYVPQRHRSQKFSESDLRPALYRTALEQPPVLEAPAVFVIAAVYERTARKYGRDRTPRYVHIEAGHAAQNLLLQAVALNLGAVPIGAFEDQQVQKALSLPTEQRPLYLIPVGHPR